LFNHLRTVRINTKIQNHENKKEKNFLDPLKKFLVHPLCLSQLFKLKQKKSSKAHRKASQSSQRHLQKLSIRFESLIGVTCHGYIRATDTRKMLWRHHVNNLLSLLLCGVKNQRMRFISEWMTSLGEIEEKEDKF